MRFRDVKTETVQMVETICLILSLGAIFLQIWLLLSGLESFFRGEYDRLWATLALSVVALLCCALTAWTTTLDLTDI